MPASVNVDDPAHWRGRAEEAPLADQMSDGTSKQMMLKIQDPGCARGEARSRGGLGEGTMAMKKTEKTRTHFTFRIDTWTLLTARPSSITWPASRTTPWRWPPTEQRSSAGPTRRSRAAGRPWTAGACVWRRLTKAGRAGVKPRSKRTARSSASSPRTPIRAGRNDRKRLPSACPPDRVRELLFPPT